MRHIYRGAAILAIATANMSQAWAQEAATAVPPTEADASEASDGADIVVTAQRRSQRLQDVPIAITAFSSEALLQAGIRNSDQLAQFTPNLTWNQSGSVGFNVGLRGIVDSNITTNQVASVGIVVDEISLNSPVLNTIPLFDLERVEVLRGPQVTLYGRSTTGGAVNFNTKRPEIGGDTDGYFNLKYGNYNSVDVEAAGSFNLGDKAAVRLSVLSTTRDGIFFNPTLNRNVASRDQKAVRLGITIEPTDRLSIFANFQYGIDRGGGAYFKSSGSRDPSNPALSCVPTTSQPGVGPCVNDAGFRDSADFGTVFADELSLQRIDAYGGLINMRYDLGGATLTSVSSYLANTFDLKYDVDGGPSSRGVISNDTDTRQFSQELRISSNGGSQAAVNWIAGLYYFHENQEGAFSLFIRNPSARGSPPGPQLRSFAWDQNNEIYSGYAQVDWKFAPRWEITLGGRYSSETKGGIGTSRWSVNPGFFATNPDIPLAGAPAFNAIAAGFPVGTFMSRSVLANQLRANLVGTANFGETWNNGGGKIGLNWKPDDQTLIYASYTRGFKGGTFNLLPAVRLTNPIIRQNFLRGVSPEKVTTYEVGTKLDLLDRTLRVNASLFWNEYSDQQQTVFDAASSALTLANAASATIKGVELEIDWRPVQDFVVQAGLGYLDAEYGNFIATPGNPLADFSGQRVIQSSKFNANALIRKSWDIGDGKFSVQGSVKYFSSFATVAENIAPGVYSPLVIIPQNALFDARIAYSFGRDNAYEVSAWGKNLSNERYCTTNGSTPFGGGQCGPNEPRVYGVAVRATF